MYYCTKRLKRHFRAYGSLSKKNTTINKKEEVKIVESTWQEFSNEMNIVVGCPKTIAKIRPFQATQKGNAQIRDAAGWGGNCLVETKKKGRADGKTQGGRRRHKKSLRGGSSPVIPGGRGVKWGGFGSRSSGGCRAAFQNVDGEGGGVGEVDCGPHGATRTYRGLNELDGARPPNTLGAALANMNDGKGRKAGRVVLANKCSASKEWSTKAKKRGGMPKRAWLPKKEVWALLYLKEAGSFVVRLEDGPLPEIQGNYTFL